MAITFESIAGGELAEKFRLALAQIGRNIMDPNADPEATRGLTIKIKFKPKSSGSIDVEFVVAPKLAGYSKTNTLFLIGQDVRTGKIEMNEYGNNRPAVTALDAVQEPQQRQGTAQEFDPETGEIYDNPRRGPIDLRAAGQ